MVLEQDRVARLKESLAADGDVVAAVVEVGVLMNGEARVAVDGPNGFNFDAINFERLARAREDAGLAPVAFRVPEPGVTIIL